MATFVDQQLEMSMSPISREETFFSGRLRVYFAAYRREMTRFDALFLSVWRAESGEYLGISAGMPGGGQRRARTIPDDLRRSQTI